MARPKVNGEEIRLRDPEATQRRILAAAKAEFARKGLGGARVDDIAARAKINKRMLYHYFGNKEELFTRTLEDAYGAFREAEARLRIEEDDPVTAIRRLMTFTWTYYLDNPEFITLVNSENLHKAKHIRKSDQMDAMNKPFVTRMQTLLERGVAEGLFRPDLDPTQILITVSGLGFHYLTNRHTGAIVYGRDLMTDNAKAARLRFNIDAVLRIICKPEILSRLEQ
ncbi:MAG TPA: TetR/AcrR family transcriptional regulator [Aestuariivirga sp.]|nr:TetR/AcrR family transcriptional regulator [Aestuariivirga sp.]